MNTGYIVNKRRSTALQGGAARKIKFWFYCDDIRLHSKLGRCDFNLLLIRRLD